MANHNEWCMAHAPECICMHCKNDSAFGTCCVNKDDLECPLDCGKCEQHCPNFELEKEGSEE